MTLSPITGTMIYPGHIKMFFLKSEQKWFTLSHPKFGILAVDNYRKYLSSVLISYYKWGEEFLYLSRVQST